MVTPALPLHAASRMSHATRPPHMSTQRNQPYRASHMNCCCRVHAGAHVRRCQLRGIVRKAAAVCARLLLRAVRRRCAFYCPLVLNQHLLVPRLRPRLQNRGRRSTGGSCLRLCLDLPKECTRAARTPQPVHCWRYVICMPLRNPAVADRGIGLPTKGPRNCAVHGKQSSHSP